jgi:ABC-type bacteriocin/lantibiotic exporter with double-glycine peptidase domain
VRTHYARRAIIAVVGARLDTKLNLHLFSRLLRLPLDYFERHPAGETIDRNVETPEDKRIKFRVGINLSDVIVEEDDI